MEECREVEKKFKDFDIQLNSTRRLKDIKIILFDFDVFNNQSAYFRIR